MIKVMHLLFESKLFEYKLDLNNKKLKKAWRRRESNTMSSKLTT